MARKRSNKNKSKLSKILSIILLIASIILLISLIYINILPITQLGIIAAITLIIDLIIITSMHKSKRKVLSYILSLFLTIIMLVGSFYTLKTTGLINNLNLNYKTYNYSVIVLKKSKYKKIDDIKNKKLGYYNTDGDETKKSLSKLSKKISTNNTSYDDVNALASSLLDSKEDAILIEDSYLKILEEDNEKENNSKKDTEGFKDKTKTIYKFSIVIKTNNISKDTDVTKKPFNIYISGIDTYGQISSVSRSDVNMIVTVNPKTKQILLTSIPRDYYVQLHGKTGYKDKLTHAGLYGADMSVKTLEDLLNIEINYYIKVNFTSVINIVEALGGVEVYSDYTFTSIDGYNYTKGYNRVNGEQALSFARERKAFSEGDRQRVKDQQALLEAMFRKCTSPAIITKYNSLMNSINGSFVTNMSANRITTGILQDKSGKNLIDLDSGTVKLEHYSTTDDVKTAISSSENGIRVSINDTKSELKGDISKTNENVAANKNQIDKYNTYFDFTGSGLVLGNKEDGSGLRSIYGSADVQFQFNKVTKAWVGIDGFGTNQILMGPKGASANSMNWVVTVADNSSHFRIYRLL